MKYIANYNYCCCDNESIIEKNIYNNILLDIHSIEKGNNVLSFSYPNGLNFFSLLQYKHFGLIARIQIISIM